MKEPKINRLTVIKDQRRSGKTTWLVEKAIASASIGPVLIITRYTASKKYIEDMIRSKEDIVKLNIEVMTIDNIFNHYIGSPKAEFPIKIFIDEYHDIVENNCDKLFRFLEGFCVNTPVVAVGTPDEMNSEYAKKITKGYELAKEIESLLGNVNVNIVPRYRELI